MLIGIAATIDAAPSTNWKIICRRSSISRWRRLSTLDPTFSSRARSTRSANDSTSAASYVGPSSWRAASRASMSRRSTGSSPGGGAIASPSVPSPV